MMFCYVDTHTATFCELKFLDWGKTCQSCRVYVRKVFFIICACLLLTAFSSVLFIFVLFSCDGKFSMRCDWQKICNLFELSFLRSKMVILVEREYKESCTSYPPICSKGIIYRFITEVVSI